jgi:hypothetical protein
LFRFSLFVFVLLMGMSVAAQVPEDTVPPPPVSTQPEDSVRPVAPPQQQDSNAGRIVRPPRTITPVQRQVVPDTIADTVPLTDTTPAVQPQRDSVSLRPVLDITPWNINPADPVSYQIMQRHPFFNFSAPPITVHSVVRKKKGKEVMFYTMAGFVLIFALLKQAFSKYFIDMMRVFFRTTMKQRQIREQLIQNPFASLIFNIFFVASAGLYITFLLDHFGYIPTSGPFSNFWLMYAYCCIGLSVIYLGKFISLKLIGWLLNMKKAADSYSFIVFIINKIIGIFLVPFIVLLAFTSEPVYTVSLVLSWCGIGALILYRFILGFSAIRKEVRFNLFHFFLYLTAFEVAPLLMIYKLLLLVFK